MSNSFKNITIYLILANAAAYACQYLIPGFTELFILNSARVASEPWRLLTSMFLHGSPTHILFNMFALYIFGPLLEQRIGWRKFALIYLISGLLAAVASVFFYSRALGASGAIMGVIGVLIILMPNLELLMFFFIPAPLWMAGIIYAAIDVFGIFVPSGVANIAHLVGMGAGLAAGMGLKGHKRKFDKKFSSKKHLDDDDIEEYLNSGRI